MKIKLILFALLFLGIKFVHAQNKEAIIASATYKVKFSQNNALKIDDICQLDITKNQSYFYSLGMQENLKNIAEKSRISDQTGTPLKLTYKDIKIRLFRFTTIKKLQSRQVILQERVGSQSLGYVVDTINTKGWKILSETMKINNLDCRKAEITKGNSKATAWFCADIPIHDGPIYAAGLPGLIVRFTTSTGWESELVSFNYNKNLQKQLKIAPYALVSEAQFKKAKNNNTANNKEGISINGDKIEKVKN